MATKAKPAAVSMFPVRRAMNWRVIERDILKIAAFSRGASIHNTLNWLYRENYAGMRLPAEVVEAEMSRVGTYMLRKVNAIRGYTRLPQMSPPVQREYPESPSAA